jgi:DNA-binding SARP family transcriptional activator
MGRDNNAIEQPIAHYTALDGFEVDAAREGPEWRFRVRLLNGFALYNHGGAVPIPRPGQRLLAYLALAGPTDRRVLSGRLWPEVPEQSARGSLRNALWQATQRAPNIVELYGPLVRLASHTIADVQTLKDAAWQLFGNPELVPRPAVGLINALKGTDLLPGWYDEWLEDPREEIRQLRMHALEFLSRALLQQGSYALALECALEVTRVEPLRETAAAAVIAVHLAEHNVVEAIRHFDMFSHRLAIELGVAPSPELRQAISGCVGLAPRSAR